MAETKVIQFNLYVDGNVRPNGEMGHRVYDLGSNTTGNDPFEDYTLENAQQLDVVQNDFITVTSMRLETSIITTRNLEHISALIS